MNNHGLLQKNHIVFAFTEPYDGDWLHRGCQAAHIFIA